MSSCESESERKNKNLVVLECGSSLAEDEHYGRSATVDPLHDTEVIPTTETIESLRNSTAADVLTDGENQGFTMFDSPFEAPKPKGALLTDNENRYLKLPLVYCDHTASNRPVKSIERYMEKVCLPLYGNTHTNTSITGSQRYAVVR